MSGGKKSQKSSQELEKLFAKIQLLVCDVDGVLTDGRLTYGDGGESSKTFHARDGMGLRMLMENDVKVGIITARSGAAVAKRMSDLKIRYVSLGRGDKGVALQELLEEAEVSAENAAYVGDDIIDIPALRLAGMGLSVCDAHPAVIAEADYVSPLAGGHGAVRDICDAILTAQVGMQAAIDKVLAGVVEAPKKLA